MSEWKDIHDGLLSAEAWLDRWAKHVDGCSYPRQCTCGLAAVRRGVAVALSALDDLNSAPDEV